ncbi:family domain-containing protein [Cystoisospora suis]|uniref:Family domain-containing protein n=1 Tax=Cystoisospora suis TaxID=483139 RepID=A0A2C6L9G1_9APIC|nr:family domain-containing protein [Cystoisospora suis]
MTKPEKVIREKCIGFVMGEARTSYTPRDSILYALGVGCSKNPLDEEDLSFTYERYEGDRGAFQILPSFATTFPPFDLIFNGLHTCPGFPEFNPMKLLHGQQKVTLFRPLEESMSLKHRAILRDVEDKKSGALVTVEVLSTLDKEEEEGETEEAPHETTTSSQTRGATSCSNSSSNSRRRSRRRRGESEVAVCENVLKLFIRGLGNFTAEDASSASSEMSKKKKSASLERKSSMKGTEGRPRGQDKKDQGVLMPSVSFQETPWKVVDVHTPQNLAVLYRLSGDTNPLHIDRQMAALGGFSRPILHGLCTFGIATRAIIRHVLENEASRVSSISARFSSAVTPGDSLQIQIWRKAVHTSTTETKKKKEDEEEEEIRFKVINRTSTGSEKVCLEQGILIAKTKKRTSDTEGERNKSLNSLEEKRENEENEDTKSLPQHRARL